MSNEPANPRPFIVVPPGAISQRDLKRLRDAGHLVITSKEPIRTKCSTALSISDRAALAVFNWILSHSPTEYVQGTTIRSRFSSEVLNRIPISKP